MLAGEPYIADDPEIIADLDRAARLMERFNTSPAADPQGRLAALRELLGELGEDTWVRPPFHCDYGWQIRTSARAASSTSTRSSSTSPGSPSARTSRSDRTCNCSPPTHPVEAAPRRAKWEAAQPITIGDNVWLGGGVIVLAGVTIGENTVVGAGAVVTRDLPANVVAVGNPARPVREARLTGRSPTSADPVAAGGGSDRRTTRSARSAVGTPGRRWPRRCPAPRPAPAPATARTPRAGRSAGAAAARRPGRGTTPRAAAAGPPPTARPAAAGSCPRSPPAGPTAAPRSPRPPAPPAPGGTPARRPRSAPAGAAGAATRRTRWRRRCPTAPLRSARPSRTSSRLGQVEAVHRHQPGGRPDRRDDPLGQGGLARTRARRRCRAAAAGRRRPATGARATSSSREQDPRRRHQPRTGSLMVNRASHRRLHGLRLRVELQLRRAAARPAGVRTRRGPSSAGPPSRCRPAPSGRSPGRRAPRRTPGPARSASAIAACRASRCAGLSGRSDHHGPATSTWSWSARRSISSPSAVKSVTVTVVVTLPW